MLGEERVRRDTREKRNTAGESATVGTGCIQASASWNCLPVSRTRSRSASTRGTEQSPLISVAGGKKVGVPGGQWDEHPEGLRRAGGTSRCNAGPPRGLCLRENWCSEILTRRIKRVLRHTDKWNIIQTYYSNMHGR